MKKAITCAVISIALGYAAAAAGQDTLVKFDGGIGVIPVSSAPGSAATANTVNRNIVRGVQPPGQPWVIGRLEAEVTTDSHISVAGRGLLLAGGNNVGMNGNASVFATLICQTATGFAEHNTTPAGVPLQLNGDFRIEDTLTPVLTGECASPVLLIRNAANQAWFAAGIVRR